MAAVRDSSMKSLLHIAVEMMGFRVVKMMMEEFNFEPNEQDISGNTPLHVACLYQKVQIVMHLLSVPYCDPNVQNGEGMTPLNVCARVGSDVVTKHLFNCRRVDKNIQDYEGKTAVEIMDANNSMLVRGSEEASVSSPPVDTTLNLGVELGLLRGKSNDGCTMVGVATVVLRTMVGVVICRPDIFKISILEPHS